MAQSTADRRGSLLPVFLMVAAFAASCAVGGYYWWTGSTAPARLAATGFDVAGVESSAASAGPYVPPAPKSSPLPIAGLPGASLAGGAGGAAGAAAAGAPQAGGTAGPSAADRAHEKEFLARHGAELAAYQARVLGPIAMRYYRNSAVVRRVDSEFARLPRYMALKRQVDKDHDPFSFARGAIALPEVRAEIAKCLADPAVWKASFGMISEALRTPPPQPVYDEAKRFMTHEETVTDYLANGFVPEAQKNSSALTAAIGPDTDLAGLTKLAQDIGPAGAMPALPAAAGPGASGGLAGQQPPKP